MSFITKFEKLHFETQARVYYRERELQFPSVILIFTKVIGQFRKTLPLKYNAQYFSQKPIKIFHRFSVNLNLNSFTLFSFLLERNYQKIERKKKKRNSLVISNVIVLIYQKVVQHKKPIRVKVSRAE